MKDILRYKGYYTKVRFSAEDNILYGKIEGISSLILFEAENASEVEHAFHEAVDDYLLFCEDNGIEPEKEYRGQFNVRVSPELHKQASAEAAAEDITLNKLVENAIKMYLQSQH